MQFQKPVAKCEVTIYKEGSTQQRRPLGPNVGLAAVLLERQRGSDVLLIGMDSNSSIGARGTSSDKTVGSHGKKLVTYSGERLRSYLAINDLTAVSTH